MNKFKIYNVVNKQHPLLHTMEYALLVIDLQLGFLTPECVHISDRILEVIRHHPYRHKIFTQFINPEGSPFERLLKWELFKESPEIDIVSQLKSEATIIIKKFGYSCVTTDFLSYITHHKIREFHIVGIETDICVLKSAVDLFELNLTPYVFSECCMSTAGRKMHEAALKILPRFIGQQQIIKDHLRFLTTKSDDNL